MAIIYNIEDYRKNQREQHPEEQFKKFLDEMGTWESPEEQDEFYRQLAKENEYDMKVFMKDSQNRL